MKRIVINVAMKGQKSRSKAMEVVSRVRGVESVAHAGPQSNDIVVNGQGIDAVKLTRLLRNKVGPSQLVSMTSVDYGGDDYNYSTGSGSGYGYGYDIGSGYGYGNSNGNRNGNDNGSGYGYGSTVHDNDYLYNHEIGQNNPDCCSII